MPEPAFASSLRPYPTSVPMEAWTLILAGYRGQLTKADIPLGLHVGNDALGFLQGKIAPHPPLIGGELGAVLSTELLALSPARTPEGEFLLARLASGGEYEPAIAAGVFPWAKVIALVMEFLRILLSK